jgi:hypothetical protein
VDRAVVDSGVTRVNKFPAVSLAALAAASAQAALIPASPTLFLRTNTANFNSTEFVQYSSLANLAGGTASGSPTIDFNDHQVNDIFWDGSRFYRTYISNGSKNKIYSWSSLEDYGDNSKATISNMSVNWSTLDDFWCDQGGNFYRTRTAAGGSDGVLKYSSFANLLSATGAVYTDFTTNFGLGDRFWVYGDKWYKTTTGSSGVNTITTYASLAALAANTAESTINTSVAYSTSDAFVFVPAPGAVTLLGAAGLVGARRRR